ncbi:hypothetical protein ACTXG7_21735 [Mycolicibacterium sp. Dal123E01]|uniref:hypothetical protein n=1 Tax=Mycolicibacterium sp. Dal123E01 TaxID=3457578 RepID=UPI00403EAE19
MTERDDSRDHDDPGDPGDPGEAAEKPHRPEDIVFSEGYRKFWRTLLGGWRRH